MEKKTRTIFSILAIIDGTEGKGLIAETILTLHHYTGVSDWHLLFV